VQITDIIRRLDVEITDAEQVVADAETKAAAAHHEAFLARERWEALRAERATLEQTARRYGELPAETLPTGPPATDWQHLSRLDAVEESLRQGGPLHIKEIESFLATQGREGDTYQLVSATLATLARRRNSVKALGRGRWAIDPNGIAQRQLVNQIAADTHARLRGGINPPQQRTGSYNPGSA
jgi:hypothetical protein